MITNNAQKGGKEMENMYFHVENMEISEGSDMVIVYLAPKQHWDETGSLPSVEFDSEDISLYVEEHYDLFEMGSEFVYESSYSKEEVEEMLLQNSLFQKNETFTSFIKGRFEK